MARSKELDIEVFVNTEWESSTALSRESLDVVYRFMDLLQLKEIEGLDISPIIESINDEHERSGM
jgi:phosphoribosyl-ATP pyrophosphohydrolase